MGFKTLSKQFEEDDYRQNMDELNAYLQNIPVTGFSGEVVTIKNIAGGANFSVSHGLRSIPKYRIILGREGGSGAITDIKSGWTDKKATFYLSGSAAKSITILLLRG